MKKGLLLALFFGCFSLLKAQPIDSLKIEELVKKYEAAKGVMVVNFWSTWCKPCIEEIPHFIQVTNKWKEKGVELLLVSQDTRKLVESGELAAFVRKNGWKSSVVWLNETNADHYCPQVDRSWSGVIPATLIINPSKKYRAFFEESLDAEQLELEIKKALAGGKED